MNRVAPDTDDSERTDDESGAKRRRRRIILISLSLLGAAATCSVVTAVSVAASNAEPQLKVGNESTFYPTTVYVTDDSGHPMITHGITGLSSSTRSSTYYATSTTTTTTTTTTVTTDPPTTSHLSTTLNSAHGIGEISSSTRSSTPLSVTNTIATTTVRTDPAPTTPYLSTTLNSGCQIDYNTRRPGSDLLSGDLNMVADTDACCQSCIDTAGCVGWVFWRGSDLWSQPGECWLKDVIPGTVTSDDCCDSGILI